MSSGQVSIPLILNPAAGGGRAGRRWPGLKAMLGEEGLDITLHRTAGPGDARALARKLAGDADRLITAGGDGTVNEVVNGLMEAHGEGTLPPALGVLPVATGNDFARSIGMPMGGRAAIRALLAANIRPMDVGRVDHSVDGRPVTRYFALACHLGLAAEVGDRANRGWKRGGTWTYLAILVPMVVGHKGCRLRVTTGENVLWDGPCLAAVLANGERLAGGMRVAPGARMDDGLLDFIGFGDFPLIRRLLYLPRLYPGTHLTVPGVQHATVRSVHLEADRPTLLDVDGETIGTLPAEVDVVPRALNILVPRAAGGPDRVSGPAGPAHR